MIKKMLPAQAVLSGGAGSQPSSKAGNMENTPGSIFGNILWKKHNRLSVN
ncbi:hypothetical protein [Akkermansia sp.]|nr:hypothetical protein [Akkermansia sp.]